MVAGVFTSVGTRVYHSQNVRESRTDVPNLSQVQERVFQGRISVASKQYMYDSSHGRDSPPQAENFQGFML